MTSILALTLSATLVNAPASPAPQAQAALLTQAVRQAQGTSITAAPAPFMARTATVPWSVAPRGGDSLKNGAIIGALIGGVASAVGFGLICHATNDSPDPICVKQTAVATGIAALGGAAIGAGVDALFVRQPAVRMRLRF